MVPTLMSWSGGKDSAMALFALQRTGEHDVRGLLTTVGRDDRRIGFHGIHADLVQAQANALGLPFYEVPLPPGASNVQYEAALRDAIAGSAEDGVGTIAYGDLFLEDIRAYREALAERLGMRPIFPVWKRDTRAFMHDYVAAGFQAVVVSVDLARLDGTFAGRRLDAALIADLPPGVDPCGENGEFHSFVFDGPNFATPVPIRRGDRVERDGYCYCELALAEG